MKGDPPRGEIRQLVKKGRPEFGEGEGGKRAILVSGENWPSCCKEKCRPRHLLEEVKKKRRSGSS